MDSSSPPGPEPILIRRPSSRRKSKIKYIWEISKAYDSLMNYGLMTIPGSAEGVRRL